jgi:hypothetical protein
VVTLECSVLWYSRFEPRAIADTEGEKSGAADRGLRSAENVPEQE